MSSSVTKIWVIVVGGALLLAVGVSLPFLVRTNSSQDVLRKPSRSHGGYPIQDPNNPCGPVCVAEVARLLKRPIGLAEATKLLHPDPIGRTSMADLIRGLRTLGFGAAGVNLDPNTISLLSCPVILHTDGSHFAVVVTNETDRVVMLDPPFPPAIVSTNSLADQWDGPAILVTSEPAELKRILAKLGMSVAEGT